MLLRFLKGIIVGIGGVAPGLSGSVLLIIFGLYRQTLDALGSLLKDFKKNIAFLLPLVVGMVLGVLAFSRVIDFCIRNFEMPTRFCFLGLIVGTLPMVWQEVKKEGFSKGYYFVIALAAGLGIWFFHGESRCLPPGDGSQPAAENHFRRCGGYDRHRPRCGSGGVPVHLGPV